MTGGPQARPLVLLDPPSTAYENDRMFSSDPSLNRDDCLAPARDLRAACADHGLEMHTADFAATHRTRGPLTLYLSFGRLRDFRKLAKHMTLVSFYLTEPPVVFPAAYRALPRLCRFFDSVYVHNTEGEGYERYYRPTPSLRKLFVPQTHAGAVEPYFSTRRTRLLVMINANKGSGRRANELYSERLRALIELGRMGQVDLYGPGWDTTPVKDAVTLATSYLRGNRLPWEYWSHRRAVMSHYKGVTPSKLETLAQYKFALCFENMSMPGYVTEKIFDCLAVGTVPLYLGASDIADYVPRECFVDMRSLASYAEAYAYISQLSERDWNVFREVGRDYLASRQFRPFTKAAFVQRALSDLDRALGGLPSCDRL